MLAQCPRAQAGNSSMDIQSPPGAPLFALTCCQAERRLAASYLLHIAQELWAGEGFSAWTARLVGSRVGTTDFLVINGICWPLFTVLTLLGILRPRLAWLPTAFAALVTVNAGLHTLGTLATSAYSPGLVTGLVLYLPIGITTLSYGRRVLPARSFQLGVVTGIVTHAVVILIAFG